MAVLEYEESKGEISPLLKEIIEATESHLSARHYESLNY
jgi:hypothetical protein